MECGCVHGVWRPAVFVECCQSESESESELSSVLKRPVSLNACVLKDVMVLIISSLRNLQPENAKSPMPLRPSGKLVRASDLQPENADLPMYFRSSGKLVSASDVQP